jgi:hypothetical protein
MFYENFKTFIAKKCEIYYKLNRRSPLNIKNFEKTNNINNNSNYDIVNTNNNNYNNNNNSNNTSIYNNSSNNTNNNSSKSSSMSNSDLNNHSNTNEQRTATTKKDIKKLLNATTDTESESPLTKTTNKNIINLISFFFIEEKNHNFMHSFHASYTNKILIVKSNHIFDIFCFPENVDNFNTVQNSPLHNSVNKKNEKNFDITSFKESVGVELQRFAYLFYLIFFFFE